MNAIAMQPQTLTAAIGTGAPVGMPMQDASGENGSFIRLLMQLTGMNANSAETGGSPGELLALLSSNAVAMQLLAGLPESDSEAGELANLIHQLLAALQTDAELEKRLAENPDFANWLSETLAALAVPEGSVQSGLGDVRIVDEGKDPRNLLTMLSRILARLEAGASDEALTGAAGKLRSVLQELAKTEPALAQSGSHGTANQPSVTAHAETKPFALQQANPGEWQAVMKAAGSADSPVFRIAAEGTDSGSQLLGRLAHLRQAAMIVSHDGDAGAPLSTNLSDASIRQTATTLIDETAQPVMISALQTAVPVKPVVPAAASQPALPETIHARLFASEMTDWIVKQFSVFRSGSLSEAKISLVPEHLGQLDVKVSVQNGVVTAIFSAETASAREMLELQLPQLRLALQQQGLQVERLVVSQQTGGPGSGQFQDDRQRQSWEQERKRNGSKEREAETDPFEVFPVTDDDYGGEHLFRYGSTFHARA